MPRAECESEINDVSAGHELAQAEQIVESVLGQPFTLIDDQPPRHRQDPAEADNAGLEKSGKQHFMAQTLRISARMVRAYDKFDPP